MKRASFPKDRGGASAIEFALVAPVLIVLAFAVFDASVLVFTQIGLEHAVESAARCASLRSSNCTAPSDIQNYASAQAPALGLPASAFSYSTPSCGSQVNATYNYYFFSQAFPNSYTTLNAQACFPFASAS